MVITVPADRPRRGSRPISLTRDIPQVLRLLETVFGESLTSEGHRMFVNADAVVGPALLWRFNPGIARLSPGFVWEEDGEIVANVTLLPSKIQGRFLVANVAVLPTYRRRGIARMLMGSVIDQVRRQRGRQILLQVLRENTSAINLYRSLNFADIGSMTTWTVSTSRVQEIPAGDAPPPIRPLQPRDWRSAYSLDVKCLDPDLNWPEPIQPSVYKTEWWRRLNNMLNGRQSETWICDDGRNHLTALATINGEWGRSHRLRLRVHPAWRGRRERPLLAKLVRRLRYLPRRNVRMDHPYQDATVDPLLREANFSPRRTLTFMRLNL